MRLPSSSSLPSPTARTLPFCGFSFAVSGRTMPLAVVSSSSTALTIRRSPRGLSFITSEPPLRSRVLRFPLWHSVGRSARSARHSMKFARIVKGPSALLGGECQRRGRAERHARLVLRAADAPQAILEVRRVLHDLREADHGDRVLQGHLAPV